MDLNEIFFSIQGEGTEVGRPSVFVRFGGCDLRCAWCDSVETWLRKPRWRLEGEPGSGEMQERLNPASADQVTKEVRRLQAGRSGLVSITGGEPLLQPEAVRDLAMRLREAGDRILLETHGLCVDGMARVADTVDVVSMDWKLKSDVRRESETLSGFLAACGRAAVHAIESGGVEVDRAELASLLPGQALITDTTEDPLNIAGGEPVPDTRDFHGASLRPHIALVRQWNPPLSKLLG